MTGKRRTVTSQQGLISLHQGNEASFIAHPGLLLQQPARAINTQDQGDALGFQDVFERVGSDFLVFDRHFMGTPC